MQLMQVQQTMQQNALAKAKMEEYTRGLNEKNTLNQIYNQYYGEQGASPAGGVPSAELARRGLGHMIPAFEKQQLEITKERGAISAQQAKADADRTTAAANKTKALGTGLLSVKDNPTDEALISAFDRMDSTGIDTKPFRAEFAKVTDLNERKKIINNYALTNPEARAALSFVTPHPIQVQRGDKIIFIDDNSHSPTYGKEVLPPQTMGMTPYQTGQLRVSEGNLAATRARLTDEGIPFGGAPAAAGAPVAAPVNALATPPAAPVNAMIPRPATPAVAPAVAPAATNGYSPKMLREMAAKGMQPDGKGGQTFIPGGEKDPTAMARLEAAKAEGTATGKDTVAAIKTLPNAIASSQKALANIDAMLGDARVVNNQIVATQGKGPHPGFSSAVGAGIGLRFIPGTPASDFQERFREVTSGAFLEAFESLRGGGSITEKEGEKATAAKTRMNLAQSEKEFVTAAREYQSIIRDGVKRAQSRLTKAQSTSALGNVVDFGDLK
jgi:hypothetical protein